MTSPLKTLSSKGLASFLPDYVGTKLTKFAKIPIFFTVKTSGKDMYLTR